ncbi:hypothetical protein JRY29_02985 [Salmonella enterica subsp. enterica serovar Kentucky]|nr:hypothetical protein JRY29_02985 [Salmonella enterica subsp. enterica serovar Kentucky]
MHPAKALLCRELHHHRRIPAADNRVYAETRRKAKTLRRTSRSLSA